jgi:hypothetical protein
VVLLTTTAPQQDRVREKQDDTSDG